MSRWSITCCCPVNPRLCASLVSDGFEDDAPGNKTRLYAITGSFASGYSRLERFAAVLRRAAPRRVDAIA
ncbi:hypothetical protein D3C76_421650 [compost metagenome]